MKNNRFIEILIECVIAAVITYAASQINKIQESVDKMQDSVTKLNESVAVVISERKRDIVVLEDHEARLRKIERKVK